MSLPPYVKPPIAGITFADGGTQQAIYDGVLSYEADAQKYATAIGAQLVNAADTPDLGMVFGGIKPTDAAQPWYVRWSVGGPGAFAGIAINQEVAAQGGTIGADGDWVMLPSGVWFFVLKPVAITPAGPVVANPADAAAWAALMGVTSMSAQQFQTTVLQALASIAKAVGAKAPGVA
jgi:hypothetical protein